MKSSSCARIFCNFQDIGALLQSTTVPSGVMHQFLAIQVSRAILKREKRALSFFIDSIWVMDFFCVWFSGSFHGLFIFRSSERSTCVTIGPQGVYVMLLSMYCSFPHSIQLMEKLEKSKIASNQPFPSTTTKNGYQDGKQYHHRGWKGCDAAK